MVIKEKKKCITVMPKHNYPVANFEIVGGSTTDLKAHKSKIHNIDCKK